MENFDELNLKNIHSVLGDFDTVLPELLPRIQPLDFVYVDGNHTHEATLRYFEMILPALSETAVVVFDDIHWSAGMTQAWKQIIEKQHVRLSIDLFFQGIIWLDPRMPKQHFVYPVCF